jgi:hypothetical protein
MCDGPFQLCVKACCVLVAIHWFLFMLQCIQDLEGKCGAEVQGLHLVHAPQENTNGRESQGEGLGA